MTNLTPTLAVVAWQLNALIETHLPDLPECVQFCLYPFGCAQTPLLGSHASNCQPPGGKFFGMSNFK
jgi:hypothetical protein